MLKAAAIAWSYDLLDAEEAVFFEQFRCLRVLSLSRQRSRWPGRGSPGTGSNWWSPAARSSNPPPPASLMNPCSRWMSLLLLMTRAFL